MAKVHYVECPVCRREYYLDRILSEALVANPTQKLKCPYCRKEFSLAVKREEKKVNARETIDAFIVRFPNDKGTGERE